MHSFGQKSPAGHVSTDRKLATANRKIANFRKLRENHDLFEISCLKYPVRNIRTIHFNLLLYMKSSVQERTRISLRRNVLLDLADGANRTAPKDQKRRHKVL